MVVRRAHHRNLDALIAQSSDTSGPFSFDRGPPFELETELAKELNRRCEVIDHDSYVVHPFKRHVSNLQGGVHSDNRPRHDLGEGGAVRIETRDTVADIRSNACVVSTRYEARRDWRSIAPCTSGFKYSSRRISPGGIAGPSQFGSLATNSAMGHCRPPTAPTGYGRPAAACPPSRFSRASCR